MELTRAERERLARRGPISALVYGAGNGLQYGRRVLASVAGNVPGGADAALGAGAAAAGAALWKKRKASRSAQRLLATPGPGFNPGSSGGYVVKGTKKKHKGKKSNGVSKAIEKYVSKRLEKDHEGIFEPVFDVRSMSGFAVFTSTTYPIVNNPAAVMSTLTGNCAGWAYYDLMTTSIATDWRTLNVLSTLADAYQADAYAGDNTNTVRQTPLAQAFNEQEQFKFIFDYDLDIKNNSNLPAQLDVYFVVAKTQTLYSPTVEINTRYGEAYNNNTPAAIKSGGDPQTIASSVWQYFKTPNMEDSDFSKWKVKKHWKALLNAGDNMQCSLQHTMPFMYEAVSTGHPKGAGCWLFRIQGKPTHDTLDDGNVGFGATQVDVCAMRRMKLFHKSPHYSGKRRITSNPTEMTIAPANQTLAGDAVTQGTGAV